MAKTPFTADWVQAGADIFQWGRKAAYWKGKKGWWASRQDHEGIKGPFRTPGAAQRWAEEPFREQHQIQAQKDRDAAHQVLEARRAKRVARQARDLAKAQEREAQALATWNHLPPTERTLQPGQVWAMRDPRFEGHQILVIEVKRTIAVVQARDSRATPWKGLPREPRTLAHIPKVYRLVGTAKVPGSAARKAGAGSPES